MKPTIPILAVLIALAAALATAAPASAAFGYKDFDVAFTEADGSTAAQAGSHPFAMSTSFEVNTTLNGDGEEVPEGETKSLEIAQVPGFAGDPTATPRCSAAQFVERVKGRPSCPDSAALGYLAVKGEFRAFPPGVTERLHVPVYNLVPPPGAVAKLGFVVLNVPLTVEVGLGQESPYEVVASLTNIPQAIFFYGSELTLWGNPADPAHDGLRGDCLGEVDNFSEGPVSLGACAADVPEAPFITLPRACRGPLATTLRASSWQDPASFTAPLAAITHDSAAPPAPLGMLGCSKLGLAARTEAWPTTSRASSGSGLEFSLALENPGFSDPEGISASDVERIDVALPAGVRLNPSQAEGLGTCSEARLEAETPAGGGCPASSKVGALEAQTPELPGVVLGGSVYVAEPYRNRASDSLIALYFVIRDPERGILVVQPARVEPDPRTGRLVTITEQMPQVPLSAVRVRLRGGERSPLITPPGCGDFETEVTLYPSAGGAPARSLSSFHIGQGPGGSPCPRGAAPFEPGFAAGTLSNAAGSYSPFHMRITRADGEQDLSRFSAVLPAGVAGKIAGLGRCGEAGIARAAARTGEHGGRAELADPSCPPGSRIGSTLAGAGVGEALTYVPGSLYLAGPYNGAPLSVVSITPAVAGPFDAGTVLVREALALNPITGAVEVDGAASDPIPHILQGIPLSLRDLRVHVERPEFTLNATSCEEGRTLATLWSAGTVLDPAAEAPLARAARYQAAGCAALAFKPKLAIRLKGGVKRGAHPALRAVVTPRPGQANFARAVVTLPTSAFLDQAHIRTICTRVQFAAGPGHGALCPKGARYGYARAWSPLLDAPAQGPVYLRSSDNKLPDLVVALKGPASAPVDLELSARIDSIEGGIRSTFAAIPDLPVSRFVLNMQGGRKGLIVNSRHLCRKPKQNRARAGIRGQNGRLSRTRPRVVALTCAKRRGARGGSVSRARAADQAVGRR